MATAKRSGAAALPVRPGEKPWTGAELDKVRAELLAEIAELRTNIDQAESEIAERLGDARGIQDAARRLARTATRGGSAGWRAAGRNAGTASAARDQRSLRVRAAVVAKLAKNGNGAVIFKGDASVVVLT